MTAFLPLLFQVRRHAYSPLPKNRLGNEVEHWDDPVEMDVYGWGPPQQRGVERKEVMVGTERYVVEVELLVPPGFVAKDADRFQLGSTEQVEANPDAFDWYRAVGPIESYDHNPFGWNPGSVVNLVAVGGVGEL